MHFLLIVITTAIVNVQGGNGKGMGEKEDLGHITVRPNAHMFWWLYYTTHTDVSNYTQRPLIIWLQGGPGVPSSGFGNFLEIGPQNINFQKREGSLVENFNVLFVDNPVGVGYSYISHEKTKLSSNGDEIGEDLYNFLKIFINTHHPEFKEVPIHILGQSYGGKMATEFVYKLKLKEKIDNATFCNVKTLALGSSYVSPLDYLKQYAPLAINLGFIDERNTVGMGILLEKFQFLMDVERFQEAAYFQNRLTSLFSKKILKFEIYNFLYPTNSTKQSKFMEYKFLLEPLMNNQIKEQLNISENINWKMLGDKVYRSLEEDLPKSVTHKIEFLLNTTDIKVLVFNGILDLITNTAGALSWLDNLNWEGQSKWLDQKRKALLINQVSEGYFKRTDNLVFYAILRAGHNIAIDNLPVLNEILRLELD